MIHRIRPIVIMKQNNLFIFGGFNGNNDYYLEIFNIKDENITATLGALSEIQTKITKNNLAMITYIS